MCEITDGSVNEDDAIDVKSLEDLQVVVTSFVHPPSNQSISSINIFSVLKSLGAPTTTSYTKLNTKT